MNNKYINKILLWYIKKTNNTKLLNRFGINFFAEEEKKPESKQQPNEVKNKVNKRDLNQPVKNEPDPGRYRRTFWTIIISLGVLLFVGLLVWSNLNVVTPPLPVSSVKNQDGKYVLESPNGNRTVEKNQSVSFLFYGSTDYIKVQYDTFYFTARLYTGPFNIKDSTNSNTTIETVGTYLMFANVAVSSTGVYISGTDNTWTLDTNLTNSMSNLKAFSTSIVGEQTTFNIGQFFSSLLPILIIVLFIIIFARSMRGMQGGAGQDSLFSIGKTQAKIAQSQVKFSDVAGIEEEKSELIEVVDYLKRPERYAAMGARVPKGVILYGPPGTGKTLLAKAVAGEAGVPFFQVSGSAFEDMLVGVGAKRVRDLFSKAVKAAPAIIFIDEIDSVGSKRGKFETTSGALADQTLNQLLSDMDGFNTRTGVIVIAATNRLDVLDEALLRPGRFDRHIQVSLPDIKERTAILKIHSNNKNLSSTVDLEDIARRTPGFSGAQLENVLNEATLLAVRKNKKTITTEELDEAIDRVIAGPAKKTRVMSPEEKKQIAYHEAGHAIVGLYTKGSEVVQKITIIPRGQAAGYTLSVPEIQELSIQKKSDLLGMVGGLLGGRASEEVTFGKESISTGAANDFYKATNIVRAMVTQLGMSDLGLTQYYPSEGTVNPYQAKLFSEVTSQLIDKEIDRILRERYAYALKIIKENKKELDLIVESLMLLETIIKPQIDFIHKHKQLPKEAVEKKKELEQKKKAKEASSKATEDKEKSKNVETTSDKTKKS